VALSTSILFGTSLLAGASFIFGVADGQHRRVWWLIPTFWLTCHGIFHIWEVMVGICGPEALLVDFFGVSFPALLGIGLCFHAYKGRLQGQT
jgi:hypothetical protein